MSLTYQSWFLLVGAIFAQRAGLPFCSEDAETLRESTDAFTVY